MRALLPTISMMWLASYCPMQAQPFAADSFNQAARNLLPDCAWIGGSAVLIAVGLLTFHNRRQKLQSRRQHLQELEREKLLEATEAVLKGEEHERIRLAKDIHDGLVGMLSGIKYALHTIRDHADATPGNRQAFDRSIDMLDSSIEEIRRVAHNIMPEALIRFGLNTALRDFCKDVTHSGTMMVTYQSIGMEARVINQTTGIAIYRIVQELIHNAIRHASATSAIVQMTGSGNRLSLTVEDNGKGFDTARLRDAHGLGWANIIHRVEYLGGRCDIASRPGEGTSVHLELEL